MNLGNSITSPGFVLLLITSQTFSVIRVIGLPYIANDKIAFLIVLPILFFRKSFFSRRESFLLSSSFLFSSILFGLLLIRFLIFDIPINIPVVNHILCIFETVCFGLFFQRHYVSAIAKGLLSVSVIHTFFALIQSFLTISGNYSLTSLFSNYTNRSEYFVLEGSVLGLPRAYGLFHEASGLSVLYGVVLLLCLLTTFPEVLPKRTNLYFLVLYLRSNPSLNMLLIFTSFIGVFLTFSLTGLLITVIPFSLVLFLYFLMSLSSRLRFNFLFFIFIAASVSIFLFFSDQTIGLAISSFTTSVRAVVTREFVESISMLSDVQFFFGSPMVWEGATWDFWSRTFQVWGLIGSLPNFLWYFIILTPLNSPLSIACFASSLTNGSLAASASLFILSLTIYLNLIPHRPYINDD